MSHPGRRDRLLQDPGQDRAGVGVAMDQADLSRWTLHIAYEGEQAILIGMRRVAGYGVNLGMDVESLIVEIDVSSARAVLENTAGGGCEFPVGSPVCPLQAL